MTRIPYTPQCGSLEGQSLLKRHSMISAVEMGSETFRTAGALDDLSVNVGQTLAAYTA